MQAKLLACIAALAASSMPAAASDDRLLLFLANPSVTLQPGGGSSIAVGVSASLREGVPDGEAPVPGITVDPKAMVVEYRRIDETLRPWVRLAALVQPPGAVASGAADAGTESVSFGSVPAVRGATYELRVSVAAAIAWMPGSPTPAPREFTEVVNTLSMGACFDADRPSEIVELITIPSVAVASPDVALADAKRAFVVVPLA